MSATVRLGSHVPHDVDGPSRARLCLGVFGLLRVDRRQAIEHVGEIRVRCGPDSRSNSASDSDASARAAS